MILVCSPNNDLCRVLQGCSIPFVHYDKPGKAVQAAPRNSGILLLADGYPRTRTPLTADLLDTIRAKKLRCYVEFPAQSPGLVDGEVRTSRWERAVIASKVFGDDLPPMRILQIHDAHLVPAQATSAHIVMARVAGFHTAVYGLPPLTHPLLFEHDGLLVATAKLSQFVTGRYAPQQAWRTVWKWILGWLEQSMREVSFSWTPTVRPTYGPQAPLPETAETQALRRGVTWFSKAQLLLHPARMDELKTAAREGRESAPLPPPGTPQGDGSCGILEGYSAHVNHDGTQEQRLVLRSDCIGESALALAVGSATGAGGPGSKAAQNLLDYLYFNSPARKHERGDPSHPAFGLIAWGYLARPWYIANYGDDNARVLLGSIGAAALLHTDRWDEAMLQCLLANLRTTGKNGFRGGRVDVPDLERDGWRHYFDRDLVHCAPHYEAYLWACFLWAFQHTGYPPFFERTLCAIRMTMAAYPDAWRWTNGLAQEKARMLLPLAWLLRVQDTPEHRAWLDCVAGDLLQLQDHSGAIREQLGKPGLGAYGPPASNQAYGQNEATLIHQNGDPLADLLYTTNFAFLGLHEAAAATGEARYTAAANKLADFLCRVQVSAETHPELDGAWFRAFDFKQWEYWASSADAGWGAWCIESGWTPGWITTVLGLRRLGTTLWDLSADTRIARHLPTWLPRFFPE